MFFEGERHDLSKIGGFDQKIGPPPGGKPVTFYECQPEDHAPAPSVQILGLDTDMAWYGTCIRILSGLGSIGKVPCWLLLLVPYFLWKESLPEGPSKTSRSQRWGFLKYEYLFGSSGAHCFWCYFPFLGFHQCGNDGTTGLTGVVIHDGVIPSGKLITVVQCGGASFKNRNLKERMIVVNHRWQSEAAGGPKGGWGLFSFSLFLSLSLTIYLPNHRPTYLCRLFSLSVVQCSVVSVV